MRTAFVFIRSYPLKQLVLLILTLGILLSAVSASAGYLDRKYVFSVDVDYGYRIARDTSAMRVYDGGLYLAAKGGFNLTGNIATIGKFGYFRYNRHPEYSEEPGGELTEYAIGGGLKYNFTQGSLIIPYVTVLGTLGNFSYNRPDDGKDTFRIPQLEIDAGLEFFLRDNFCSDISLGYQMGFGDMQLTTATYDDPDDPSDIPTPKLKIDPITPTGITLTWGFILFL